MTKGSYEISAPRYPDIEDGPPRRKRDNSFLSCLCVMLVVLAICILLLLVSSRWCRFKIFDKKQPNENTQSQLSGFQNSSPQITTESPTLLSTFNGTSETSDGTRTTRKYVTSSTMKTETDLYLTKLSTKEIITTVRDYLIPLRNNETTSIKTTTHFSEENDASTENSLKEKKPSTQNKLSEIIINSTEKSMKLVELPVVKNICNSSACDLTAARMISSMNELKQPCDNFYEFACGGIFKRNKDDLDIFVKARKEKTEFLSKFNIFYQSCVKHEDRFNYEERIERAKSLLKTIGLFQFDGQKNTTYDITEFIISLILYKAMPLFEVDVDVDPQTSAYILKLLMPDQTSLAFEHWSSYTETKRKCLRETSENAEGPTLYLNALYEEFRNCRRNYSDFLDSIATSVEELGIFSNLTENNLFKHVRDIRVSIEFDVLTMFEAISEPPMLQEMMVKRRYENIKLKDLEKEFPLLHWEKLFSSISNKNINGNTVIQMYNRKYFEKVFEELTQIQPGALNNAFLALLASSLFENTVLPSHRHSRVKYCQERTGELMPDVVNYLYKTLIPAEQLKEQNEFTKEIYNKLKVKFNDSLGNSSWLDEETRGSIRKKLDNIELAMFRTDDLLQEKDFLEQGYANLQLNDDDFQYNLFELQAFRRKRLFSIQGEKVTHENMYRHFVDATKEQPVFFYSNDIVCIPYGLTKWVNKNLPDYVTIAQIGFPLAKIIGNAFDPVGIQYRVKLSDTANISYSNFADQTRDVIFLMNPINFENYLINFTLNNALSESERFAENTALRLVTNLLSASEDQPLLPWISSKYSEGKIFFIAVAQEFCRDMNLMEFMIESYESHVLPPQFRIENIFGNSEIFAEEFSCRPGSTMTRIEDRLQFPHLPEVSKEDLDYL